MGEYPYPVPESIEDDYENSYALMVPEVKAGSVLPNPPPNLVGVGFVVLQDVFVVDSASHMLRLGRKEGFGRRF